MIIIDFINSNFIPLCTFIGTLCALYGVYNDKTPAAYRSIKKVVTNNKVKLDNSKNKQNKPTINFTLFNITINNKAI